MIGDLSAAETGERLRVARESRKITQAAAADALEMSRTTIVAIEQGQRRPKLDELQRLAALYGVSVNTMLRREAIALDLKPRFRRLGEADADVDAAVEMLATLLRAELELENLLGVVRSRNDPPERPLLPGNVILQAEQDAAELRLWLGLGAAPIHDMMSVLELQLGVRVFVRRLPSKISGLYAFDEKAGACILLNASHPKDRRMQTAAHELGHFVSARKDPDAFWAGSLETSREEKYATIFARAFLTPARSVMAMFKEITAGASQLTRRHVIILAHAFGVSREAMVRRLEELDLTKAGTWDWFRQYGGISDNQAQQVLGDAVEPDKDRIDSARLVSMRLALLIREAWAKTLLSEGQIAQMLHLDRVEVRELIDAYEDEDADCEDLPRLVG